MKIFGKGKIKVPKLKKAEDYGYENRGNRGKKTESKSGKDDENKTEDKIKNNEEKLSSDELSQKSRLNRKKKKKSKKSRSKKENDKGKKLKKKKNNKVNNILFGLLFIIGLLILLYPRISDYYYRIDQNNEIEEYEEKVDKLDEEDIKEQLEQARRFNEALYSGTGQKFSDPFSKETANVLEGYDVSQYPKLFKSKEVIGYLKIPKLGQKLSIKNGASEAILRDGVGYLPNTSLPVGGKNTHTVLTAHRGLPQAKLFREIDKLKKGDKFYVYVLNQKLAYEVDNIKIVLPSETEELRIYEGKDYATLLSCHPYTINSHRILVRGHRVPYIEDDERLADELDKEPINFRVILLIFFILIIIVSIIIKLKRDKIIKRTPLKDEEDLIKNQIDELKIKKKKKFKKKK